MRALLVHVIDETAAIYYQEKANMLLSKDNPLVLFLTVSQIIQALPG